MAEGLGGIITVKSLEANFTKFTLSLPVKQHYIKFDTKEQVKLSDMGECSLLSLSEKVFEQVS